MLRCFLIYIVKVAAICTAMRKKHLKPTVKSKFILAKYTTFHFKKRLSQLRGILLVHGVLICLAVLKTTLPKSDQVFHSGSENSFCFFSLIQVESIAKMNYFLCTPPSSVFLTIKAPWVSRGYMLFVV